jgi:hypothetical protein
MRRALLTAAALVTLLAAPASASAGDAPRLRAVVSSCQTGADPASRAAAFTASMPAAPDTVRMAIRFELHQRTVDGGVWEKVAAPSFDRWERSRPGVSGFVWTKDVRGLTAPGEFRAVVRFRWWSQSGRTRTVRKVTRSCRQPDLRPNLLAGRITAVPSATPGLATYHVPVRNRGRSAAGPFSVALRLNGAEAARTTVEGLAPGEWRTVALLAPACSPALLPEVRIDPENAVDEAVEEDGIVRPGCPFGS